MTVVYNNEFVVLRAYWCELCQKFPAICLFERFEVDAISLIFRVYYPSSSLDGWLIPFCQIYSCNVCLNYDSRRSDVCQWLG